MCVLDKWLKDVSWKAQQKWRFIKLHLQIMKNKSKYKISAICVKARKRNVLKTMYIPVQKGILVTNAKLDKMTRNSIMKFMISIWIYQSKVVGGIDGLALSYHNQCTCINMGILVTNAKLDKMTRNSIMKFMISIWIFQSKGVGGIDGLALSCHNQCTCIRPIWRRSCKICLWQMFLSVYEQLYLLGIKTTLNVSSCCRNCTCKLEVICKKIHQY